MPNLQRELLKWAADQPALTGLVILAGGVLFGFFGFRMFRFLLGLTCAGLGWFVGTAAAIVGDLPAYWLGPVGAVAFAGLSLRWVKPATGLASGTTWALLGYYLPYQLHLPQEIAWLCGGIAGLFGMLFAFFCYQTTTIILTTVQGVVLMIVGFVAATTQLMPSIGVTFRQWANRQALLIPALLAMLAVTAFSYQAMRQQGDIRTGK